VSAWLPLLAAETAWLLPPGFVAQSIEPITKDGERLVVVHARTTAVAFPHGVLPSDKTFDISTLQAYLLFHAVVALSILAAWSVAGSARRRIALLLVGVPCVLVTTSLDVPFVLAGLARS
jgi:hypothetical protein